MPMYEYTCEACAGTFERLVTLSRRDEVQPCPECGEPGRRRISAFAVVSPGRGFGAPASGGSGCAPGG